MNNNGNVNNNNKYNELTVVPLAELEQDTSGGYKVSLSGIWDAYYDCIRNKAGTINALLYMANVEHNNKRLWEDINNRTYRIGKSIAFIVEHPVKREVFAADFRDRIVHHWICLRLVPLFEQYLSPRMFSNRKGKGTGAAIRQVTKDLYNVSKGYTRDCWIWKFDFQGFFMSIDKRLLNRKLQSFIDEHYKGRDIDALKWLTEKVVMHCPQHNCVRKSKPCAWEGLRADKSLFNQDDFHGLAIGNLTSQIFANFLLFDAIIYLQEKGFNEESQYVDDFVVIHEDKYKILATIPGFRIWLKENLGVTLHPKKNYIQHYSKGVSFVGAIIKPHRNYISKRSRHKLFQKVHWIANSDIPIEKAQESVNSYFGYSRACSAYKIRQKVAGILWERFHKKIYFNNHYNKMVMNKSFTKDK